ncbi:cyclin domain protein F-box protein [Candidatus Amoebophilus asiaticus 5a2]|uniref:Cyclin domain protein F-box protein n=1 Tax=Amoebophilus asiaticus (strain 5a2) TaxID=452471 RepID=B3EU63_AMOA5|nr:F-box-like domain-containing protein [Candidatus Amoebophilus asiaticus]ACE05482.1 cyclin domain protein F-box protein [Candidatus Amoebophilus asiaticus 5a2]
MRFFKRYFNNTQPILARLLLAGLLLQSCGDNLPQPTNPNNSPHSIVSVSGTGRSIAAYPIQTTPSSVPPQPMLCTVQPTVIHSLIQPAAPVVQIVQQATNLAPQHILWTEQPTLVLPIVQAPQPMQAVQQHNTILVPTQPVIWTNQSTVSSPIGQPIPYPMQAIPQTTSLSLPSTVMPAQPSRANVAVGHQGSSHASYRPLYPKDASTVYPTSHVGKTRQAGNSKRKFEQMAWGEGEIFSPQGQIGTDKRPRYLAATQQVSVTIEKEAETTGHYNLLATQCTQQAHEKDSVAKQETSSLVKDQLELERMLQEAIDELDRGYSLKPNHLLEVCKKADCQPYDNFYFLPPEILEHILSYLPLEEVLKVRRWNKYFCRLIGDYPVLGGTGVQNELRGALYIPSLKIDKVIDFNMIGQPQTISSFFFYQLIRNVKNIRAEYGPYLKRTKVQKLDLNSRLGFNFNTEFWGNIKTWKLQELAEVLPSSQIEELDLAHNLISQKVQEIAELLLRTRIKKVNLRVNRIGDEGVKVLAKALPHSQLEEIDLRDNGITLSGAQALAEALPKSKIKRLYLSHNKIGDLGIQAFARILPGSQLEELNFIYGADVTARGVQEIINVLPASNIKRFDIRGECMGCVSDIEINNFAHVLPVSQIEEIFWFKSKLPVFASALQVFASALQVFASALPTSKVKRIMLDDIAASEIVKYEGLKRSQVKEIRFPKMTFTEAKTIINELSNTPVKTIHLGFHNTITLRSLRTIANLLKDTSIEKVFLYSCLVKGYLNSSYQKEFKQQYPNIEWIFDDKDSFIDYFKT